MHKALIYITLMLVFLPVSALCAAAEKNEKLLKVVALSRHGVRAPTQSEKILDTWSQKTWPVWPVPHGDLTPRGAALVTAMWENMREAFDKEELFPVNECPGQSLIHVRADTDERTKATARALLNGLAPNCNLGYAVSEKKIDPLFHPVKAGLYQFQVLPTVIDVLGMTHGGLENLQHDFTGILNLLDTITGPLSEAMCFRYVQRPDCQLSDLSNVVSVSSDGKDIRVLGSLSIASSLAEIFLLEYAEWPDVASGWGLVNSTTLSQILPIHSKIFDVVNRAPTVAWARGSSLLTNMWAALSGRHEDASLNEAKLVIFVGHDTNIANIGALLNANWQANNFPHNGIPPASLFAMELWEKNGKQEIRLRFYAQPLKALHSALPDNTQKNADKASIKDFAPACVTVNVPPVVGEARFTPKEFMELVAKATKGAPLAPAEKLTLDYSMPIPSQ